ncbi:hypothetical protein [Spirosoma montaniterrae]|uniref:Uncharacterized protein n=1 Tax=Spirosoma montaniterrae TaxID=1178516 RepID=A0A1P9WTH9_9BACT|nr:hypothetical protein [Spirosoma montaniterrae]AQG78686.1 hypothetical protein AWR27_04650 [Spirosoma montaniterrae]
MNTEANPQDSEENRQASGGTDNTAPDSETQSSVAANQGRTNNADIRSEETGADSFEKAEGE